jgi:hypothetical protein
VFERWRKHEPAALHADEPEHHLVIAGPGD